jgi:hypothetical protein
VSGNEFITREPPHFFGGACQTNCETTENSGKNGNNGSGNSGYFIPVVVNEMSDWNDDRAAKSGAVFLWLLFGFLVFIGCFWWVMER